MPRIRALVLLGLFLVNQAACTSWQVPKVTPQEYAAQHRDSTVAFVIDGQQTYKQRSDPRKMRFTLKDEQGQVALTGVRFSEDSVFGQNPYTGQPIAFSLQRVRAMEVRRVNGVATGPLVAAIVVPIGLLVGAVTYTCDTYGC